MIVDTSALLAYFDARDPAHAAVAEVIESGPGPNVVSPFVLAEIDYLVLSRFGVRTEMQVLRELTGGAWELASVSLTQLRDAADIVETYGDFKIGLTDAMNVVLAQAYRTTTVATLDRRHFSTLRRPDGKPLTIVP